MRGSARLWAVACFVALAATVTLAVVVKAKLKARAAQAHATAETEVEPSTAGCFVPPVVPVRAQPDAEDPPVLLWAVGSVRLQVDDVPAFSSPEAPKHFKVGEHVVKVTADGAEPLRTRVRLDAFTPALFHAESDGALGLTLARVGSLCVSCPQPLDIARLDYQKTDAAPDALLSAAAQALRKDDWMKAADSLRGLPTSMRDTSAFHRLASGVFLGGLAVARSRQELELIPEKASNDLRGLLKKLDELTQAEQKRRAEVVALRWNKVTERFQGLIHRFNTAAPGPTALASRRIATLSDDFQEARKKGDLFEQEKLLQVAEKALLEAVVPVRAARPEDCDYQASVVTTVTQ